MTSNPIIFECIVVLLAALIAVVVIKESKNRKEKQDLFSSAFFFLWMLFAICFSCVSDHGGHIERFLLVYFVRIVVEGLILYAVIMVIKNKLLDRMK
jgi:small basic protein